MNNGLIRKYGLAIIAFIVIVISLVLLSNYLSQTYITELIISPEDSFKVKINDKTTIVKGKTIFELKPGRTKVEIENEQYDKYSAFYNIERNDKNTIVVDMNKFRPSIKNLGEIKNIEEPYSSENIIQNVEYLNSNGYWAVIVAKNKSNSKFSIFAAKRENNEWVLKNEPIFRPSEINEGVKNLPSNVSNFFINDSINYFGELG